MKSSSIFATSTLLVATTVMTIQGADLLLSEVGNFGSNCLAQALSTTDAITTDCNAAANQLWETTSTGEIKRGDRCLAFANDGSVKVLPCDGGWSQRWQPKLDRTITAVGYPMFDQCITFEGTRVKLSRCTGEKNQQFSPSSILKPPAAAPVFSSSRKCMDYHLDLKKAYMHDCHHYGNQIWTYTDISQLQTMDVCLQYEKGNSMLSLVPCEDVDNQKWYVDKNGRIQADGRCADYASGEVKLEPCDNNKQSQVFDVSRMLSAHDKLKRRMIQIPKVFVGTNCLINNPNPNIPSAIHAVPCRDNDNKWWEYTKDKELKTTENKCIDLTSENKVLLWPCHGGDNQKWNMNERTGVVTSGNRNGGCLEFNTENVKEWYEIYVRWAPSCDVNAPKDNQIFSFRDFVTFLPPSIGDAQKNYCSNRAQYPNDLTFLRDTLVYYNDLRYFIPSNLSDREKSIYNQAIMYALSVLISFDVPQLTEPEVIDKLTGVNGLSGLFELGDLMCRVLADPIQFQQQLSQLFYLAQPSATLPPFYGTLSYLRSGSFVLLASTLNSNSILLPGISSDVFNSLSDKMNDFFKNSDFDGLLRFLSGDEMTALLKSLEPVCKQQSSLTVCTLYSYLSMTTTRKELLDQIKKDNQVITFEVLDKAEKFMQVLRETPTKNIAIDTKAWASFSQFLIFGATKPVTYSLIDMIQTSNKDEILLVFAVWPFFSKGEMNGDTWKPFFTGLSDQLTIARRTEIGRIVHQLRVRSLEAYFDGRTSDLKSLVVNIFPRICSRFGDFSMCTLLKFYELVTAHTDLQRSIKIQGNLTDDIVKSTGGFVNLYTSYSQKDDELWSYLMAQLVFGTPQLLMYSTQTTLQSSNPEKFFLIYPVFSFYSNDMQALLPYFTFFIDQVTVAHFRSISKLIDNRNVAGMESYMDKSQNVSDLAVLGTDMLPLLCNNPNNPMFSVCKLQEFYSGLKSVISFEKNRGSNIVSLVEVAEVDVRKQLDVLDGENKQFEIISTIQDSANQIGKKIQEESENIQAFVKEQSQAILSEIDTTRQVLYEKMGEEGRKLQAQIDESTRVLEETIGDAADAIRDDIAKNTKLLYNKMDDESRAIQRNIDENTKKLSTQIGEEARATRQQIKQSTDLLYNKIGEEGRAIRQKIDQSTDKLYNKIDQEGKSIRQKIDQSTEKLYNKIGEEGQKTRNKIDESTQKLTNVINESTAKLENKIDQSTNKIVGTFKQGFTSLADYYKNDAKAQTRMAMSDIKKSVDSSNKLLADLGGKTNDLIERIRKAQTATSVLNGAKLATLVMELAGKVLSFTKEAAQSWNPIAWITGAADPGKAAQLAVDIAKLGSQIAGATSDMIDLLNMSRQLADITQGLANVIVGFGEAKKNIGNLRDLTEALATGDGMSPEAAAKATDQVLACYENFQNPTSQREIEALQAGVTGMLDIMQKIIDGADVADLGSKTAAKRFTREAREAVPGVFNSYLDVFSKISSQYQQLGGLAQAAVRGRSADNLGNVASSWSRRRRLGSSAHEAATTPFKPFYPMAYAGLSKLFMQYKLQLGAFQFCKFYEYKLGGIPPSMCGKNKYYTPQDIQQMRSWQPPSVQTFNIRALLPTKPKNGSPYLDLDQIKRGEKVSFALPANDLTWLKKYNWVFRTDTDDSLAGIFIESFQLVLPFTSSNPSENTGETFDTVANVAVGSANRLNGNSNKTFVLPPAQIKFTAAINDQFCQNEIVNPYHQTAKCVKKDGSSSLCVYENGEVARKDLLPSLFSQWEISSTVTDPNALYKLALPGNTTESIDLDVIALLKVVRVSKPSGSFQPQAFEADDLCCAEDEYFTRGKCSKCPSGSTGALNGYSCQLAF